MVMTLGGGGSFISVIGLFGLLVGSYTGFQTCPWTTAAVLLGTPMPFCFGIATIETIKAEPRPDWLHIGAQDSDTLAIEALNPNYLQAKGKF